MNALKYFLFTFLFLLAINCASAPSRETMQTEIKGFELPQKPSKDSALVYVVRPFTLGGAIRFNVFLDDQNDSSEMGYTRANEHVFFYTKPGKCKILSKAENWAELNLELKAGQTTFIQQNPEMGIIMARNSLTQLDELQGLYFVKNTNIGTILKEKK